MDWFDKKSKAHVDTPTQDVVVVADRGSYFARGRCCDVLDHDSAR